MHCFEELDMPQHLPPVFQSGQFTSQVLLLSLQTSTSDYTTAMATTIIANTMLTFPPTPPTNYYYYLPLVQDIPRAYVLVHDEVAGAHVDPLEILRQMKTTYYNATCKVR